MGGGGWSKGVYLTEVGAFHAKSCEKKRPSNSKMNLRRVKNKESRGDRVAEARRKNKTH